MIAELPLTVANDILARRLPKADLHCHLQGTMRPSQFHLALAKAKRRIVRRQEIDAAYDFLSFEKFFSDLDAACASWGSSHAITLTVLDTLAGAYDLGCRHLELMVTPDLHRKAGLSPEVLLIAVGEAFKVAAATLDMSGGIIVDMLRDRGRDAAVTIVRETCNLRDKGVPILGYGNDGDHRETPFEDLIPAYRIARQEGYRLCGHAANVNDVRGSLDLAFERIDHGFFAASDPVLTRRLVDMGTPLTLCPTSGVLACGVGFINAFRRLSDAGVPICLSTDDPPLFFTDIAQEYRTMGKQLDWTPAEMGRFASQSLRAAWLPSAEESRKLDWKNKVSAYVDDCLCPKRGVNFVDQLQRDAT